MTLPPDIDAILRKHDAETYPTGSRFICDPPPLTTDEDYLVVVAAKDLTSLRITLTTANFEFDCGESYADDNENNKFWSYRRDDLNLLITADYDFARKHKLATQVCKALNLLDKKHRITVFQAILYDRMSREVTVDLPDLTEPVF